MASCSSEAVKRLFECAYMFSTVLLMFFWDWLASAITKQVTTHQILAIRLGQHPH